MPGSNMPSIGASMGSEINNAGSGMLAKAIADVYGDLVDAITYQQDRQDARCHRELAAAMLRCQEARTRAFLGCLRRGLRRQIDSSDDLAECLEADPFDHVSRSCSSFHSSDRIHRVLDGACRFKNYFALFPGCGTGNVGDFFACIDSSLRCRYCQEMRQAENLEGSVDCDDFDDRNLNESCF